MRNASPSKHAAVAAACALALGILSAPAVAQDGQDQAGLVTDSSGAPAMSPFGLCWHSGFGPRPADSQGCYADDLKHVARDSAQATAAAPFPLYEKVVFDANVLFDSGKSVLRPAGRDTLDEFISKISGLESRSVLAIGYADRMGTEGSNQILSEDRVNAVKAYLVGHGIASKRVQTSAKGETQPTTFASECKDANTPKNVDCMQPDRHVFIEVSGERIVR
jgi:OmpA-OmpF porin, OOP family